jgi:predicted Zn-dependent protease
MARSVSVAGIDAKGSTFCSDCRSLQLEHAADEGETGT